MILYISEIVSNARNKSLIIADCGVKFCLYNTEIQDFGIREGGTVDDVTLNAVNEILCQRALKYCIKLLEGKDYSIFCIKNKLKIKYYTDEAIEFAVNRLIDKGYLNDENFAENYYELKKRNFGIRRIKNELIKNGISDKIIDDLLSKEEDSQDSMELITRLAVSKCFDLEAANLKEKNRFYKFLVRKGIDFDSINRYFSC